MLVFSRFSRYFLEVARLGSLRKAADVLNVSASAIDRQILLAESELETELFERLPTGLRLTAAGELLLADVRRWRKEFTRTKERFDELRDMRRGHISIGMIDALTEGQLADVLTEIGVDYPGLSFDLRVVDNWQMVNLVDEMEVDFALMLDPVEHASLDIRPIAKVPIGVVMPVDHPLAQESRIHLSRVLDYPQIMPASPLLIHERIRALYAHNRVSDKQAIVCNSVRMVRSLIRNGAGVGILSWLDAAADVADGRLAFVPLQDRQVKPFVLALCIAPRRQLSRAAQMVIERITKRMQAASA